MTVEQTQGKEQANTSLEMDRKGHEQSMRGEGLSKAVCEAGLKLLHIAQNLLKKKPLLITNS